MKKITFSPFLILLLCCFTAQAQVIKKSDASQSGVAFELTEQTIQSINETGYARCLTDENEIALKRQDPDRMSREQFEEWLAPTIAKIKADREAGRASDIIYNIPVVIHVIHDGDAINTIGNIVGENISDAQALSQIQVLNEDYRRLVGTPGGANSTGLAVDVEINFCAAEADPNGGATNGVVRHNVTPYTNNVADGPGGPDWETRADVEAMKRVTQWDPNQYLNMWTIRAGGQPLPNGLNGLLGYAQFPNNTPGLGGLNTVGGAANTDGVVAGFDAMGTIAANDGSFVLNGQYNLGRTMTHEVGHWLGLRHIWGDGPQSGSCGVDDFCADTPNAAQPNFTCNLSNNSCTNNSDFDQVQNYMDYTNDACMDTFTQNQKDRIQAIMASAPRRLQLNSSTACTITPAVYVSSTIPTQVSEGNACGYQDIEISLALGTAGNASATASLVNSGTATENADFELLNNSVTFAQGSTTAGNTVTLRIYEDGLVETDETIILNVNVTTTGDTEASSTAYTTTIINDDLAAVSTGSSVLFSDGFETYTDWQITPVGEWTMLDNDGDNTYGADDNDFTNEGYIGTFIVFNPNSGTPPFTAGWDAHSGDKGYYCFNSAGNNSGTPQNDDYIFTPQISLNGTNSELKFWAQSLTDNYNGGERFQVGISTTDTNPASFTIISPSPYINPPTEWTEYTYDLSAYDGQDIYVTFHVVSADEFVFMLDDVSVTADTVTEAQTDVNTPTTAGINETGAAYYTDANTRNIMIDVDNTGGFNYGCVDVSVSRDVATAGAAAIMYEDNSDPSAFVTAKTFNVTTSNANTSDASTINFYFSEAELSGWETITGNSRSELFVKKEGTDEITSIAISAFGSDSKLSASFTTGLEGTYVFGTQLALLSRDSFDVTSGISIYPNPTTSVLNIKTTDSNLPDNFVIYNMLGQVIKTVKINGVSDLQISTSEMSNGMYFIKISKDNTSLSLPFIKK